MHILSARVGAFLQELDEYRVEADRLRAAESKYMAEMSQIAQALELLMLPEFHFSISQVRCLKFYRCWKFWKHSSGARSCIVYFVSLFLIEPKEMSSVQKQTAELWAIEDSELWGDGAEPSRSRSIESSRSQAHGRAVAEYRGTYLRFLKLKGFSRYRMWRISGCRESCLVLEWACICQ